MDPGIDVDKSGVGIERIDDRAVFFRDHAAAHLASAGQLTVIGVSVGLAGAFGVNRLIASLLFGVEPTDAATMATVIATISLVAAVACWLPAWHASRLDPNVVLRTD